MQNSDELKAGQYQGIINESWYSSATDEWGTPQDLFDKLNAEFNFTLDACASAVNHKVDQYYTRADDALNKSWSGTVWMNPPYGKTMKQWMAKAVEACETNGAIVVCLVPARTDTAWFWDYAMRGEIRFIRGRLKYVQADGSNKQSAPFPSAIVIFDPLTLKAKTK